MQLMPRSSHSSLSFVSPVLFSTSTGAATFAEIGAARGLDDLTLKKVLHSLSCGKNTKVLSKTVRTAHLVLEL